MTQRPTPAAGEDLPARILALETAAFHAWPALQEVRQGGWVLRLAGGFTKRANSANAAAAQAPFHEVQAAAEAFYARHGLPPVFRLTPLAPPEADLQLQAAGYARFDPSRVMVCPLGPASSGPAAWDAGLELASAPSPAWLDGFAAANGVPARHQAVHHAMVQSIARPAAFATLRHQGQPIGFGLAVRERDAVGFFDIVIAPPHRRRGHATRLMQALLRWARDGGAQQAYLQVRDGNPAARRLYAGLGFADLYGYHYRVPPGMAG
ncbi:GNAT family N-acetyltransferase [Paracidovorax wautersii]|uniref:Acetyltransferase (GNAT) family protein n=1 Tax=Paracidovorax wautersii TaxID=1177982 RepID=A0A1I2F4E2_9BURK|nr:GNAT family N-acetyltransferase [Paracidovorax wautersii]SFE99853.1 Acetyltransferase (GNAT) family protein [Paracidovorax wautersii]